MHHGRYYQVRPKPDAPVSAENNPTQIRTAANVPNVKATLNLSHNCIYTTPMIHLYIHSFGFQVSILDKNVSKIYSINSKTKSFIKYEQMLCKAVDS